MTFISKVKDGAINGWHTHQILPSISIAQAILESASGTSSLGAKYLNLFGIKASDDWTGKVINLPTLEYGSNGAYSTNANFRWYDSWNESMLDHAAFFTNTPWRVINYAAVVGEKDYKRAAQALQSAGYATDPLYATKLIQKIEQNNLTQYDTEAFNGAPSNAGVIKKTVGGTLTELAKSAIKQYNVTLIGDSLGVGTQPKLMGIFRGFSHDVLGSRQITHATNSLNGTYVLQSLKDYGQLKDIVVVVLGTNRGVTDAEIDNFVAIAGSSRKVIFVDTNSQVGHRQSVSDAYKRASERHNNVYFANWMNHSNNLRSRYYGSDNIHMTNEGYQAHADLIKMAVYEAGVGVKTTSGIIGTTTEYIGIEEIDYKDDDLISPKGESIVYNHPANELWGSKTGDRVIWIESILEVDSDDPQFILNEAVKVMKANDQPAAQYVVDLAELPDDVSIGDWGYVLDHEFNPPLYIHARVLEIITSETDTNANKAVVGNVTEVFPVDKSDIKLIQADLKDVRDNLVRDYRKAQPVLMLVSSTNGSTLGDKYTETELVAKVTQGAEDLTNKFITYKWERVSNDTTSDDAYNAIIETETTNRLIITSKDIVNNLSTFVVRVYDGDNLINQSSITIKHVDTALWTDTNTPPSDAKDGATWTKPDGTQWVKKDGVWEERVDQALVTAITTELEKAQGKVEEVEELADLLDQKVIEYQQKIGSDGNPEFNKNRADKQQAISRGEAVPLEHNGYGFVAGKQMTLSFKALCVPISKSDLILNFTADDLLPLPSPITKSNMTLNLIVPGGTIPTEPIESNFKNARVVNLSDYGGSSSNTDNFTALKSAINASASEPLILEIEAGIYNLQGSTNDRIQMEPWESAKSKGLKLVGKGDVVFRHKHNRTVNKHEYYFMQVVFYDDSLGFEVENITLDGIRNPQEELFYTQSESNPVPNIPLTRGIATTGAHRVVYKNVRFKNMYGGYAIQMAEYRDVTIEDVTFDKVGGNDIQESFGMAIYLGGHSGNAIVNIDNAQAQGMVTDKELKLSWIGVVLENGSIQSNNPNHWMRDKNTTVNITNSSFMDYQSTFHVESMAGNVYWNVDGLTARGSNYQIVAGVYGEYKESSNNVKMDMMPYGRLWGIVHGLWYTEAQETADNISGHNKMDMYNSVINLKTLPGFGNIPQAVAYGNSVKGYLHNTQLNDVPYKLVQNGSAYLYDSVVNLSQVSGETRASLQTGMFGTGAQEVVFDNTLVNAYANRSNVTFGAKPAFVKNTGFVAPFIELPISPPL